MADVKAKPDGYRSVTPYLIVAGASEALDWYTKVLGATERMRMAEPSGKIGHAEIEIGDSVVMLADEYPDMDIRGPRSVGGSPVTIHVYVDDVDAVVAGALTAGAKERRPVADQFYGDRVGQIEDPFGHQWSIATHVEDVPPDEMMRRAQAEAGGS